MLAADRNVSKSAHLRSQQRVSERDVKLLTPLTQIDIARAR